MADAITIITQEEFKKHNKKTDCWICLYGRVYNITQFGDHESIHSYGNAEGKKHPGGDIIYEFAGKDGTMNHLEVGHSQEAHQLMSSYEIGYLENWKEPKGLEWPPFVKPLPKSLQASSKSASL